MPERLKKIHRYYYLNCKRSLSISKLFRKKRILKQESFSFGRNDMKQRELTDQNGTRWTCVQAYGGPGSEKTEDTAGLTTDENNKVAVICTPTGGAKSVRLRLKENWISDVSEKELLQKITRTFEEQ